ncbi:hypothetical protein GBF38_010674 [Nibea albiflora]|uniref:Uncharacterized protein n=1 Tax=Nibea albiflora TaxID=240163 RepID=A0ACB7ESN4_NIBAL|nr:hypothetical protein GBF38_010674 [Nibea albiflora]
MKSTKRQICRDLELPCCPTTRESVVACSLHNTVEVGNSPPHQLCHILQDRAENGDDHANTHFIHELCACELRKVASRPS